MITEITIFKKYIKGNAVILNTINIVTELYSKDCSWKRIKEELKTKPTVLCISRELGINK